MTQATIQAGICGFTTHVKAESPDEQNVELSIDSDCEHIRELAAKLATVDAYAEIGAGWGGIIHHAAESTLKGCCAGCIVPSGIFKTVLVAARVALPQTASIQIHKETQ